MTASCQAVSNWMASNQHILNADKTHILTLGTDKRLQIPDYEFTVIVDGLTFQSKWHDQIKELKSKLKKRLVGLSHIKYQEIVWNYCLPLFGGCDVKEPKDLQVLQIKAARSLTHSPLRTEEKNKFNEMGWLSVKQFVLYHTMLTVYRIRKSQEPEVLDTILSRDKHYGKIIIPNIYLSHRKSLGSEKQASGTLFQKV